MILDFRTKDGNIYTVWMSKTKDKWVQLSAGINPEVEGFIVHEDYNETWEFYNTIQDCISFLQDALIPYFK